MARVEIDARGLKCPLPSLKMNQAVLSKSVQSGDTLVVVADCPTFENDVRQWCSRTRKVLLLIQDIGNNTKRCEVRI